MEERLQKIIARAGIASRRHAEELITSGLVTLNGRVVTELGTKADAARDHIKVNGKLLQPETGERIYLLLHKPPEVVSTMNDPEGRPSLRGFLHAVPERVYPVGRLEYHASGLVLLTNDGDFANKILQSHNLPQTYQMKLKSLLTFAEIETLERETGAKISRERGKESPWYDVTLSEASQDALRSRLFQTGHPVEKIRRVQIGNLGLDRLMPGQFRLISAAEAKGLLRAASQPDGRGAGYAETHQRKEPRARRNFQRPVRREFQPSVRRDAPRERPKDERERSRFRPKRQWKKDGQREAAGSGGGNTRSQRPSRGPRQVRAGQGRGERTGSQPGERRDRGQRREHQAPWQRQEGGARREGSGQRPPRRDGMRRDARPNREGGPRSENASRPQGRPQRTGGSSRGGGPRGKQFDRGPGGKKFGSGPRRGGKH
jgi:23S rRNA pseudouridine2605 synthase